MTTLRFKALHMLLCLGLLAVVCAGCASGPKDGEPMKGDWHLTVEIDGSQVKYPLKVMNVMLVEDEERWPESFEIVGDGVALVGEFPADLHVGYEAEWSRLFGRTIPISQTLNDYSIETKESTIRLPGRISKILRGEIKPEKLTGKWAGRDGDLTLSGTMVLEVEVYGDEVRREVVEGTFSVHCVTWG